MRGLLVAQKFETKSGGGVSCRTWSSNISLCLKCILKVEMFFFLKCIIVQRMMEEGLEGRARGRRRRFFLFDSLKKKLVLLHERFNYMDIATRFLREWIGSSERTLRANYQNCSKIHEQMIVPFYFPPIIPFLF